MWELTAAQTKLFLPPTTSRWLAFFDMEKKEDKMNPFQEAQTVPELRYDEIQVGDQASLTKTITDEDVINLQIDWRCESYSYFRFFCKNNNV